MSNHYCFLCASNEGLFLDVTPDNQSVFSDQLETCLTTKIDENIELTNKVCYKCAYELDQCTKFMKKYKDSHQILNSTTETKNTFCCLCLEITDKNRIFDISKDNRGLFSPLQKIRNIFSEDFTKDTDTKLICLTCRYNLDVLYDLKKIYQETVINLRALIKNEIDYTSFPKIHTDVVNRKTTITTFPDITFYGSLSSDSDTDNMSRKSRVKNRRTNASQKNTYKLRKNSKTPSSNVRTKVRTCDECCNIVANGDDMYRFHRTGLTVCKTCWITMDPSKGKGRRRTRNTDNAETKLCTVFLTDVMSDTSLKNERIYKMEKDEDGNKFYLISDDSSEERLSESSRLSSRLSSLIKSQNHTADEPYTLKKLGKKRMMDKSNVEDTPSKMTRSSIKMRLMKSDREQSPSIPVKRNKREKASTASSDSDVSQMALKKRAPTLSNHVKSTLSESGLSTRSTKKSNNRKRVRSDGATPSEYSDRSSNEDGQTRKKRNTSSPQATIKSETEIKLEIKSETCNRMRSSSISSVEMLLAEFKSPKSMEAKTEYACDKCNKKFDNKISSIEHKLTHFKQITLKLEKVNVNSNKEPKTKADLQEDEISKETCLSETACTMKHSDDSPEEIAINLEDDTDDDETFSLLQKQTKIKDENKESDKTDVADKLDTTDMAEDESQRLEKSTKSQNDKNVATKEHEECEEATTKDSDKSVTSIEKSKENVEDKDETDQAIKASIDEAIDTSKDEDTKEKVEATVAEDGQDAKECDEIQTKNDTKVLIEKKKERSNSECSNDAENIQEAITHDGETMESLDSNRTKDQDDENRTNESKSNCQNSEDTKTQEVEITESNLGNKSEEENNDKKDQEKTKEANKTTPDTIDTKVSSDDEHSNADVTVAEDEIGTAALEQQQKEDDVTMIETIVNVSNDMNENTKSDVSSCEKLAEITNTNDDVILLANNNDVAKAKEITEEEDAKDDDDPKEKEERKQEDDAVIKSLEQLIKETVTNEQFETNSSHAYNSPTDAANEILSEVFNLAAAEVQKRESNKKNLDDNEMETLENISREIRNSADMPSLDPINVMELDDDDDDDDDAITLD